MLLDLALSVDANQAMRLSSLKSLFGSWILSSIKIKVSSVYRFGLDTNHGEVMLNAPCYGLVE
jgi:hypothetical protein